MKWSFKYTTLESDAAKIQTKIEKEYTAAKSDVTTTDAKVKSTKATVTSTNTANTAKGADDKTKAAWDKAVKAHAAAVKAHDAAVTKEKELEAWTTWITHYMTNNWADDSSQPQFKKWMENSFLKTDLKSDAAAIQDT